MSTDIDWHHELDSSFGSGHDVPPGHYVAVGRTAVRRRRVASVAIVAAMTVGVGAAWASVPGGTPRGETPVATPGPTPTADAEAEADNDSRVSAQEAREKRLERMREAAREEAVQLNSPAALTYIGLVLAPGAGPVLERVPNPMGYTAAQGRSVGIRVRMPGGERYALLTVYPDAGSSAIDVQATGDFDGWLSQAVRTQNTLDVANGVTPSTGDTTDQPWLALANIDGVVAARPGVVIVEQRVGVDLGAGFPGGGSVVRLVVDGRPEYAIYRVLGDGTLDVIPAGGGFDSMGAFIDWARQQYASGEGMR